jgi:hypothetical protein
VTFSTIDPDHNEIEVVPLSEYEGLEGERDTAKAEYRHLRAFTVVLLAVAALMGLALVEKAARAEGTGQRIEALR